VRLRRMPQPGWRRSARSGYVGPALSPATEIRLIAAREIRRSVRSVKGIVLGVITLLGAFVTSLVCVWLEGGDRASANAASTEAYTELRKTAIEKATGDASFAAYAASIPTSLLVFLKVTVWLAPLLIALLGFDVMSSELQHRSVRFWTVRTRRWSYFTGKMLGLWAIVALMMLALNVMAGVVATARGYVTPGQLFTWGIRFWLVAVLIAGSWAAIATFISSCFRTPMLSLLTTFLAFFVMWVVSLIGFVVRARDMVQGGVQKNMAWYEYLYPNTYDTLLLSPETTKVLTALGVLVGFVVLANVAGATLFQRRDI
jgi:ABC-type transport system involved in multi-copper enzyme maturation permease subunit